MDLTLAFHGGAGTVTGSRFLLSAGANRILIDCGLFQGLKELRLLNWRPPAFDVRSLDAVLVTHAHIDHTGYLPRLVREGFRGPIYATPATLELAEVLLLDAARLQEEDAEYANRKGYSKHHPALPLFTTADAEAALRRMKAVDFDEWLDPGGPFAVRYQSAGHILGSAHIEVRASSGDYRATVVFSGDVGRYDMPLHIDPVPPPPCDALVLESTYGDRLHEDTPLEEQLRRALAETVRRGGTVLIPAFAVARVQLVTLMLRRLMESGALPEIPIHIDSPMAVDVTRIYQRYLGSEELDSDVGGHASRSIFPRNVRFHRSVEESRALNDLPGPRIIISSSGMLTGGRVLHHLRRLAGDPKNLIALAGYQAVGTRGRALLEGATTIRMHGEDIPVRARVISLDGFSAHADASELVKWALSGPGMPETIFLAHGEPDAQQALAARLRDASVPQVSIPRPGQEFTFVPASRRWRSS